MATTGVLAARLTANTSQFRSEMTGAATVSEKELKRIANGAKLAQDYLRELARIEAEAQKQAQASAAGTAAAIQQQTDAQRSFLAALQEKSDTNGMDPSALMRYRAAQLGVGEQAEALISKLAAAKAATDAKAAADAAAAEKARANEQAIKAQAGAQQSFLASLRERAETAGMDPTALVRYKAAQLGVSEQAEVLVSRMNAATSAMQAKAAADAAAATKAREDEQAIRAQASAQAQFMASLKERVDTNGMDPAGLMRYRAAQLGVGEQAEHLITQLHRTGKAGEMSAGQTAAAMRSLPAQMTDIVSGLATGQSPFMVLMQQGGQLKDMFGGIAPAAKAVGGAFLGMVNPITITAAAAGALVFAYKQGSDEASAYSKALAETGNYAGRSSGQLQDMAAHLSATVGTQHAAAAALAEMAGTGRIAGDQLESLSGAAVAWERATGTAVADVAKQFVDLGKTPVESSLKLNETMHYLTASTYKQIKAMEEQGRSTDAGRLAQDAYASALKDRSAQMESQLGSAEKAWRGLSDAAKSAWDKILNVGRSESLGDKLAQAQADVKRTQIDASAGKRKGWFGETIDDGGEADAAAAEAQRRLHDLQISSADAAKRAGNKAAAAKQVEALAGWDKSGTEYLTDKEKKERAIAKARQDALAAGVSDAQLQERIAAISDKFKDKKDPKEKGPKAYQGYLNELAQQITKQEQNEFASMRLKAEQLAQKDGVKDLTEAYKRINALQSAESLKVVQNYSEKLAEQRAQMDWTNQLIGKTADEQEALNAHRNAWIEAERVIQQARQSGKPLTDAAVEALRDETRAQLESVDASQARRIMRERETASEKMLKDVRQKNADGGADASWQISIMGETAAKQAELNAERGAWLEMDKAIRAAQESGRPYTAEAVDALRKETGGYIEATKAAMRHRDELSHSAEFGSNKALQQFADDADNQAKRAADALTNGFKKAEDAIVSWAKTGKLSVSSFFSGLAEEYLRTAARTAMVSLFKDDKGRVSVGNGWSNIVGAATTVGGWLGGFSLATGTNYVPYDGMPATLHKGEAVVPAAYNPANGGMGTGAGGGGFTDNSTNTYQIGTGVSRGEVQAAIAQANAKQEERMKRLTRQGAMA